LGCGLRRARRHCFESLKQRGDLAALRVAVHLRRMQRPPRRVFGARGIAFVGEELRPFELEREPQALYAATIEIVPPKVLDGASLLPRRKYPLPNETTQSTPSRRDCRIASSTTAVGACERAPA